MLHFIHSSFPFVKLKSQMPYVGVRIKSWEKQESSRRTLCAQTTLSCPIKGLSPEKDFSGWRIMVEQKEERSKASAAECNKCCLARPHSTKSTLVHQKHKQRGGQEGTPARKAPATTSLAAPSSSKGWHKTQSRNVLKSSHFTQNPSLEKCWLNCKHLLLAEEGDSKLCFKNYFLNFFSEEVLVYKSKLNNLNNTDGMFTVKITGCYLLCKCWHALYC